MFGAWKVQLGEFFDVDGRLDFNFRLERRRRRFLRYDRRVWAAAFGRVPSIMGIDLRLAQAREVVVDGIFGIEAEVLGVRADKSFIKDSAGKQVEVFLFDRLQHARADLGYVGNVVERELFLLARLAEFFAKLAHVVKTLRVCVGNIIGQPGGARYGTDGQGLGNQGGGSGLPSFLRGPSWSKKSY